MARISTRVLEGRAREACASVGFTFNSRDVVDGAWLDNDAHAGGWRFLHRYNGRGSIRVLNGPDRMGATVMLAFLDGMLLAANTLKGGAR